MHKFRYFILGFISIFIFSFFIIGINFYNIKNAQADTDDSVSGYAWNDILGWISFNCTNTGNCGTSDYGVNIEADGNLTGYAWSDVAGWIWFDPPVTESFPSLPDNSAQKNPAIGDGNISGWARVCAVADDWPGSCTGGSAGWIKLSCDGAECGSSNYGVNISSNDFHEYAWSDDYGWISFNCAEGGPSHDDICATVPYKVAESAAAPSASVDLFGWAWSEHYGWATFNCTDYLTCLSPSDSNGLVCDGPTTIACGIEGGICVDTCTNFSDYRVAIDAATGHFSGYAWSPNLGWISFDRTVAGDPPTAPYNLIATDPLASASLDFSSPNYGKVNGWAKVLSLGDQGWIKLREGDWVGTWGVEISTTTGDFSGWAWGASGLCSNDASIACYNNTPCGAGTCVPQLGIGWLSFNSRDCDLDGDLSFNDALAPLQCPDAASDPANPYKVTLGDASMFNSPPSITSVTASPTPALVDDIIEFEVNWSDNEGHEVSLFVCKAQDGSEAGCGPGGVWCSAGPDSSGTIICTHQAEEADVNDYVPPTTNLSHDYYIYVCDEEDACSTGAGSFQVNRRPEIGNVTITPAIVNVGEDATFHVDWVDADDEVFIIVCQTNEFSTTTATCDGGEWCRNAVATTTSPAVCSANVGDGTASTSYAHVCDMHAAAPDTWICSNSVTYSMIDINHPPEISNLLSPNWPEGGLDSFCEGETVKRARLKWTYNDDAGDTIKQYRIFASTTDGAIPNFDSGICDNTDEGTSPCNTNPGDCIGNFSPWTCTYDIPLAQVQYGKSYKWAVEVWDNHDLASGPLQYDSVQDTPPAVSDSGAGSNYTFTVLKNEYPDPWFDWTPKNISLGESVLFSADLGDIYSEYYPSGTPDTPARCTGSDCTYYWEVTGGDANIVNPYNATTTIIFNDTSTDIQLWVCDEESTSCQLSPLPPYSFGYEEYTCSTSTEITTKVRLPTWIETN